MCQDIVRNGMIEKFNDHYQQKFLGKVMMTTPDELCEGSYAFEQRHNSTFRYSRLGGKTPLKALATSVKNLRFRHRKRYLSCQLRSR